MTQKPKRAADLSVRISAHVEAFEQAMKALEESLDKLDSLVKRIACQWLASAAKANPKGTE